MSQLGHLYVANNPVNGYDVDGFAMTSNGGMGYHPPSPPARPTSPPVQARRMEQEVLGEGRGRSSGGGSGFMEATKGALSIFATPSGCPLQAAHSLQEEVVLFSIVKWASFRLSSGSPEETSPMMF
jgi:hypothetical protein